MMTDKQLRERIEEQIGWWPLLWEHGPGDFCGAAFETEYLVDQAGNYRGVRLRMTEEQPHIWVDTLTGRVEATDSEHTYTETLDDLLTEGTAKINWWLSTLWITAWHEEEREQFNLTVIGEAAEKGRRHKDP